VKAGASKNPSQHPSYATSVQYNIRDRYSSQLPAVRFCLRCPICIVSALYHSLRMISHKYLNSAVSYATLFRVYLYRASIEDSDPDGKSRITTANFNLLTLQHVSLRVGSLVCSRTRALEGAPQSRMIESGRLAFQTYFPHGQGTVSAGSSLPAVAATGQLLRHILDQPFPH